MRKDKIFVSLPLGEGGPLAVDEVFFNQFNNCTFYVQYTSSVTETVTPSPRGRLTNSTLSVR